MVIGNLFGSIPAELPEELFETLLQREGLHLERIVSRGHITAPDQWYDQQWDEWVVLLSGSATLRFATGEVHKLTAGDHLMIPAHHRHRVDATANGVDTIWLALHLQPVSDPNL